VPTVHVRGELGNNEGTMLNNPAARKVSAVVIDPVARLLLALRISPDAVTVVGTTGACVGALVFFPRGDFLMGVLVIVIFIASDLLDGTMARISGRAGPWGNFLDATLDRIADGSIFGGLLLWAAFTQNGWVTAAALISLVGGQVISYAKARAEAVGATANVGLAERAERLIIGLGAALLAGLGVPYVLPAALIVLAVLTLVTIGQRLWHVRGQLKSRQPPAATDELA
jgi:CDP-diacylglycerol--glycerol-3-phosphate 3-phosphatidyltransferase